MTKADPYDAVIIGGGPAGSTAAAILAERGRRVLVLEKEQFPRYHIGESLMPYCYFTLERIGLVQKMETCHFTKKYSVQFVRTDGHISQPFYFFQHFNHPASTTWQVWRSEFDQMLLDNAREKGAEVRERTRVKETVTENGFVVGVRTSSTDGPRQEFRAPMTIDASGRDSLTMIQRRWRKREDRMLNKVSIWTYYEGAMRDQGLDEGATTVAYLPDKGWFWYIPLPRDVVSVGVVADKDYLFQDTRDPAAIFEREIKNNPWIERHLACGKRCEPFRMTGEYSYRSRYCAADGLVLVGDAWAFLDPIFSSGVFLALKSGELAAEAVDVALDRDDFSADQFSDYSRQLSGGLESMRKLVYAFYDHEFSFGALLDKYPEHRGDLTDCLIGNLFKDFRDLFEAVDEFARLPEPVEYGKPFLKNDGKNGKRVRRQSQHTN